MTVRETTLSLQSRHLTPIHIQAHNRDYRARAVLPGRLPTWCHSLNHATVNLSTYAINVPSSLTDYVQERLPRALFQPPSNRTCHTIWVILSIHKSLPWPHPSRPHQPRDWPCLTSNNTEQSHTFRKHLLISYSIPWPHLHWTSWVVLW